MRETSSADTFDKYFNKGTDAFAILELVYNQNKKPIDFICKDINEAYEQVSGFDRNQILGKKYSELDPEMNSQFLQRYESIVSKNTFVSFEHYSESRDLYYNVSILAMEQAKLVTRILDITDLVKAREHQVWVNKILKAARTIHRLLLKEISADEILHKTCEIIAEALGSDLVWISRINKKTHKINQYYCSDRKVLENTLSDQHPFSCIEKIQETEAYHLCLNHTSESSQCPILKLDSKQAHLLVPIVFNQLRYGVLNLSLAQKLPLDSEGSLLFRDLANDLAFALFNLEVKNDLEFARKRIRKYYQEIDNQNKKLIKLNVEFEQKNNQLKKANEKALESQRLKSSFLANVSHEIRTPLNGILGFTQLIKQPSYAPEKIEEYLDIISQSGNQLLTAINSILDISRIESRQLDVKISNCNIHQVFDDILLAHKFEIYKNENVEVKVNVGNLSKGADFRCDELKLKQILNVLVQNSIKFTQKGFINIAVNEDHGDLVFVVEDTGIGISIENFKLIFESFRQSDETNTRKYGGIGLGLSIAKGLVKLLNGEIWLKSELEKGSSFYVRIPYLSIENKNETVRTMDFNKIETLNWSSKTILIVEDDMFSSEYLAEALGITQVNIVFARNGNDAIDLVKNNSDIDLVLMDIQLPDLSGDKAANEIRSFNLHIPIIAQTAHAMANDKEGYLKLGCSDYISKPISVNDLFSMLCKYF